MKIGKLVVIVLIVALSCKNNDNDSSQKDMQVTGRWKLLSETKSGNYFNSRFIGGSSDSIQFKDDGKAYSRIQGQYDLVYNYNLNAISKTLFFEYVTTHSYFMTSQPCVQTNPGCQRLAHIKYISDNILVIGNTFSDTTNGIISNITIVDSLYK